ncbi:bifunctional 4-hydroxy-2-oxoglutarate aldolase/2-dehydro-3-deoxy-phosphogluconate aldolase [Candidatus Aerophobetes bacterium]|uniref:Bifunctional 4-hydroxy-2-oxoglutarate aldolase/2-dehydro-3-deoxy-phosphogluconate aldolase n=1 Tax=Aerophobetes bacterium TaxID=2030807 RepID=A0A523RY24_UNCAE|nr:MAG: bifunctional 4-hydroxy-2-oxoglutarate aldolase/2-dehydro-3-deoxy-phosphogluconate aldolase [Candidatus Aerophobetes bacterium]
MRDKTYNLKMLLDGGIIPVVRASSSEEALKIVDAIREGGIEVIEITMTVPDAIGVMKAVAKKLGDEVLLGAGTVLDAETARISILTGAEFVVGPSLNEDLIRMCKRYAKIVIPGAMTPTEILRAWEMGADVVKVFPADQLGGPGYIRAIKAPLPQVLLNPTGGVNLENAGEFIKAGASIISVGSALVDKKAVSEGKFEILTRKARQFLEEVKRAREG